MEIHLSQYLQTWELEMCFKKKEKKAERSNFGVGVWFLGTSHLTDVNKCEQIIGPYSGEEWGFSGGQWIFFMPHKD